MVNLAIPTQFSVAKLCRQSQIGKLLPDAFYVHISTLSALDPQLQTYEQQARLVLGSEIEPTLMKFSLNQAKVSYLIYPDFDTNPHPVLHQSIQVNLNTLQAKDQDFSRRTNPPILHRKETFVTLDYPLYQRFSELTQQEEALGLLEDSSTIGTLKGWQQRLREKNIEIHGHYLACPLPTPKLSNVSKVTQPPVKPATLPPPKIGTPKIERHRAAIARVNVSKPVRLAMEAGLFNDGTTFFDYGCGHGVDIEFIDQQGYLSSGYDPYFRPEVDCIPADVVNLGYVINVIENTAERREALLKAWELTQNVLIVAAQVMVEGQMFGSIAYGDGVITRRNTFQKYYEQEELKAYIDQVLGVDAVAVALGIYFVFRDEARAESFRASRFRSRATAPRIRAGVKRFEEYKELLQPLMDFFTERGRLPTVAEIESGNFAGVQKRFGSLKRAFRIVLQATDVEEWDAITEKRRQDLLVYLALSQFGRRPKFKDLAIATQNDIKALFGSYQQACTAADLMLMSLGNLDIVAERCRESELGQQHGNSLWVHVSVLERLDPLLRLYEGCASRTIGRPEEATVVKFHLKSPRISYLFYPTFDAEPHPKLRTSMQVDLQTVRVHYQDYDPEENPPLLHQKEQVVAADYPGYEKFAKLSQQERKWGLLEDLERIQDLRGWQGCLAEHCAELRGHRVVWRKDADPYQVKVLKSLQRKRDMDIKNQE
ncbi:MAG: DNA phosphorothioation-associated putative methyltransferase [Oscillatoriales cyanobacterium RM2_1_1]|nr:DNA phosphorothioation-associated putative methyltransferase [Oscillatoriales cyanobacterium SM2_3_0]NJO44463.1 DNA phosphorothioation-associated putative methyltransferase [Oscillatoriales cyanobacterium RM2_1_1]